MLDGLGVWLTAVALWCAMNCGAAAQEPDRLLGGSPFALTFPQPDSARFYRIAEDLDRAGVVRLVVGERLTWLSPDVIDVIDRMKGPDARLLRGMKFGLVTGAATFTVTELAGGDSWLIGSFGLGAGLLTAALTDLNWPPTYTLRYGADRPFTLGLGWLTKPGLLPRSRPLPSWHGPLRPNTAGIGLTYRPTLSDDVRFDLFADPFASRSNSQLGAQFQFQF